MKLGIDIRSLLGVSLTGVGVHLLGVLSGITELRDVSNTARECTLWSTGSHGLAGAARETIEEAGLHVKHRYISNKALKLSWLCTGYPSMQRLFPGIDYHWLPNLAIYPYRKTAPYAITVHDLSFEQYPQWFSMKWRALQPAVRLVKLLTAADCIIAVSESTARTVRDRYPELESKIIQVITPAVRMAPGRNDDRVPWAASRGQYLLYVGTLEPRKNIAAIITAFQRIASKHPDLRLVLAGQYGWSSNQVMHSIKNDPKIEWLRYVSDHDREELYARARVLLWPSFYEGFGFPPLEALTNGIPVITSYRTSLPEVLRQHALYVNPYNTGELAEVLDQVLTAPQVPEMLRKRPSMYHHRSWRDVASDYLELFEQRYAHRH